MANTVKMTHPDLEAEIEVPADTAPVHEKSGWTVVEYLTDGVPDSDRPRAAVRPPVRPHVLQPE